MVPNRSLKLVYAGSIPAIVVKKKKKDNNKFNFLKESVILDDIINIMKKEIKKIILSDKDRDKFLEMLKNPPEPNEVLQRGAARYKQMVQDGDLITNTSENWITDNLKGKEK